MYECMSGENVMSPFFFPFLLCPEPPRDGRLVCDNIFLGEEKSMSTHPCVGSI